MAFRNVALGRDDGIREVASRRLDDGADGGKTRLFVQRPDGTDVRFDGALPGLVVVLGQQPYAIRRELPNQGRGTADSERTGQQRIDAGCQRGFDLGGQFVAEVQEPAA